MSTIKKYVTYLFSTPKLYRIYSIPQLQPTSSSTTPPQPPTQQRYTPPLLESLTDGLITYILPLTLLLSIYNRKLSYLQFTIILYITSRALRSLSRLSNPDYTRFLSTLERSKSNDNTDALESLQTYDFEFSYFPVTYTTHVSVHDWESTEIRETGLFYYASWLIAHSFGIRLIYPGLLLGGFLSGVLEDGRSKFVVEKRGRRVKVRVDGGRAAGVVELDSMVFDRRGSGSGKGDVLVICCEGNAGFYEIGMLGGALSEGYSVLGWNHPGFGGSTGVPYPATELAAALGIMDYAMNGLGFKESEILLYGWSIGGFPAGYLASRYPGVKGLLLDATFDTILPLAIPRMPEFMTPLVISTIQNHVNLNNLKNLEHYEGPLRIIRRTEDEIIADPPGVLGNNRGNFLLGSVVVKRFETLVGRKCSRGGVGKFYDWVKSPHDRDRVGVDCLAGESFSYRDGMDDGDVLIGIASSILRDYKATHCVPLPREFYKI